MVTVGVRELKEHLSEYLRAVAERGEEVTVTSHGRTVARVLPPARRKVSVLERLRPLADAGLLELPALPRRRTTEKPVVPKPGGASLSEMIIEDRR